MAKFSEFNLNESLIKALNKLNYVNPTPIQSLVIPKVLRGESLVVKSETGSGKTHAFLVPILNNINFDEKKTQAIILAPTRELANQIYNFTIEFKEFFPELTVKLISSVDENTKSIKDIKSNAHILIATCGRLHDLVSNNDLISLSNIKFLVLDEADMIIREDFIEDLDDIIHCLKNPQILVFSATMNKNLQDIFLKYIDSNFFITTDSSDNTSKNVVHYAIDTRHEPIEDCLDKFLAIHPCYFLLIFVSKKTDIDRIYNHLNAKKLKVAKFHGDLETRERKSLMKRIRNDEFQYVVCSDIAARGIDIPNCDTVLSIDLPNNIEFYFHRAGRTGRYDRKGESFVFYDNDHTKQLIKLLDQGLNINFVRLGDGEFVDIKPINYKKKFVNKSNSQLEFEMQKARSKVSKKKVKPNYKKKANQEAQKVKQKYRREAIKKDIRRQRVERYKKDAKKSN